MSDESDEVDASGSYETYLEYNKVLRTWFVAYGVGGPALVAGNKSVAENLVEAGCLRFVATLFFVGVGAQVIGAIINKAANWYVYSGYGQTGITWSKKHKLAEWIAGQFWIDILLDVATVLVFGLATWTMLTSLATVR